MSKGVWFGVTPDAVTALRKKQAADKVAKVVEMPKVAAASLARPPSLKGPATVML